MDKELYELLKEISRRKHEGVSRFSFNDEKDKSLNSSEHLMLALRKLMSLGLVTFSEDKDLYYDSIFCQITYDGQKALSHGSYEAYLENLPVWTPLAVHLDQSFKHYGDISGSNIAVHSHHVSQAVSKASEVEKLFQQIIDALQQDRTLAETKRQELIEDVQNLKRELQRTNPRPAIIAELYSFLGTTASIASYLPQLQALIQPLLP